MSRVAIWMPFPGAIANPGEVVNAAMKIVCRARDKRLGQWLPQDRCGQMDYGRTRACLEAIEKGFTHILMLDADHRHEPSDLVERLLRHDVDVVGSLNYARGDGRPCALPLGGGEIKAGSGLVRCGAVGTGSMLVRLAAIRDIPQPWFFMPYGAVSDLGKDQWPGEDGGFCLLCRGHGIKMYCDTDINSPHANTEWI